MVGHGDTSAHHALQDLGGCGTRARNCPPACIFSFRAQARARAQTRAQTQALPPTSSSDPSFLADSAGASPKHAIPAGPMLDSLRFCKLETGNT